MSALIKIEGLQEVKKNLKKLEKVAQGNALRAALRETAKPIKKAAIDNVPIAKKEYKATSYKKTKSVTERTKTTVQPGRLRDSIRISSRLNRTGRGKTVAKVSIKAGNFDVFYAKFVEFGTRYVQPRPFMRTAFAQEGSKSTREFAKHLKKAIEKQLKKAKRAKAKK